MRWTQDRVAVLRALARTHTYEEAARVLGVSRGAVSAAAQANGISFMKVGAIPDV